MITKDLLLDSIG